MTVQIVDPRKAVVMLANDETATQAQGSLRVDECEQCDSGPAALHASDDLATGL